MDSPSQPHVCDPRWTDKETEDLTGVPLAKQIPELVRLQVQRGRPRPHLGLRGREACMAARRLLTACVRGGDVTGSAPGGVAETPPQGCHAGSHASFSALINGINQQQPGRGPDPFEGGERAVKDALSTVADFVL